MAKANLCGCWNPSNQGYSICANFAKCIQRLASDAGTETGTINFDFSANGQGITVSSNSQGGLSLPIQETGQSGATYQNNLLIGTEVIQIFRDTTAQYEGAGEDYTFDSLTGTITWNLPLSNERFRILYR